jgi:hypothetical protein
MRKILVALTLVCAGLTGCQHTMLTHRTVGQTATLNDLYSQQVLNNIALFSCQPDALPTFAVADQGVTNLQREAAAAGTVGWERIAPAVLPLKSVSVNPGVRASAQEQWSTSPSNAPEVLGVMRCAYQRIVGRNSPDCECKLQNVYKGRDDWLAAMTPGWYGVGKKHDVPKDACYVGHHCDTYVWVKADGVGPLALVTLAMLDVATIEDDVLVARLHPDRDKLPDLYDRALQLEKLIKDFPPTGDADRLRELRERLNKTLADIKTVEAADSPAGPSVRPGLNLRKRSQGFAIPLGNLSR